MRKIDEDEYSVQERRFIMNIQNTLLKVKKQGKPLSKRDNKIE